MNESLTTKNKIILLIGAIIIIVLVVLVALNQRNKIRARNNKILAPIISSSAPSSTLSPGELAPSKSVTPTKTVTAPVLEQAREAATGTSLITPNNIVVTPQGAPVKLNVMPAAADAPRQSIPIKLNEVKDTANTIKLAVNSQAFTPKTFTVRAGQLVNFVLTSTDNYTHIFMFKDPALTAAILGVASHETREISWNAPEPGTYKFYDAIPGRQGVGGEMIVK